MNAKNYLLAREAVFRLNRFVRPAARLRKGERKSHFEEDCRTARSLLADPNILGFGVGPKVTEGERESEDFCVAFFVRRKLPKSRLRNFVEIKKHLFLNTQGRRVRTDVQQWSGTPIAHGALNAGASIGDVAGNAGTMTLAVQDKANGAPLILGCSHVLAACGNAHLGDEVESPGNAGGDPGPNVVGRLLRFTRIDPLSLNNAVDAAVATPVAGVSLTNKIPGIGIPSGIRDLTQEGEDIVNELVVQRVGVVTGRQTGTIRNLHVSTRITYHQLPGDPSVYFVDLMQYDALSEEGDSGAVVVESTDGHRVVGMHIAGLPDGSASLCTHIRYVLDRMNVVFAGGT